MRRTKLIIYILSITLVGILLLSTVSSNGQEGQKKEPWKGKLADGTEISEGDLSKILEEHKKWLETDGKEGQRADLSWSNLIGSNLSEANLSEANLIGSNLSEANLYGANLSGANLSYTDLSYTDLSDANLSDAILFRADLSGAKIDDKTLITEKWRLVWEIVNQGKVGEDLSKADLSYADLSKANLNEANLGEANLIGANLTGASLAYADLSKANLNEANLSGANLWWANLSEASLVGANLSEAKLNSANLSRAFLVMANLSKTELMHTNLKDAIFSEVDLTEAQYEPSSAPDKGSLAGLKGLTKVWFNEEEQSGLVQLREALKDAGLRNLEREATYVIEYGRTYYAPWYVKWTKRLLFEWTSGYGLNYLRPLLILSGLILVFSIVYIFPIVGKGKKGIYRVWSKKKENGIEELDKLNGVKFIGYAFYFSVLSTFHIGWRDLNVGSWIARIQPNEYFMKATGWVRTVSGVQSLISIYLLALWALTQFGRPFE